MLRAGVGRLEPSGGKAPPASVVELWVLNDTVTRAPEG